MRKFFKRIFCKHIQLKMWMPLEVTTEYTYGIWKCENCGKERIFRVWKDKLK